MSTETLAETAPTRPTGDDPGEHRQRLVEAIKIVTNLGYASVTLVQRRLKIGYTKAKPVMDLMVSWGVTRVQLRPQPPEVLVSRRRAAEIIAAIEATAPPATTN